MTDKEAMKLALDALETECDIYREHDEDGAPEYILEAITALKERLAQPAPVQESVAWISVKDELPKSVRGVSYKSSLTDTVLVLHSDRPDYPITAHAVVGEGLGAGVAIPTDGASEHPEIAWYSASCNLNNPFNLKNDDYERFLPKIFGSKITHWMPIPATPPQRTEQEPAAFAGIEMWIGNARIKRLMTQPELHYANDPWAIMKFYSDRCIDALKESDHV